MYLWIYIEAITVFEYFVAYSLTCSCHFTIVVAGLYSDYRELMLHIFAGLAENIVSVI